PHSRLPGGLLHGPRRVAAAGAGQRHPQHQAVGRAAPRPVPPMRRSAFALGLALVAALLPSSPSGAAAAPPTTISDLVAGFTFVPGSGRPGFGGGQGLGRSGGSGPGPGGWGPPGAGLDGGSGGPIWALVWKDHSKSFSIGLPTMSLTPAVTVAL